MRSGKSIFFFFLFAIAFCGCKKDAISVSAEFEGVWDSSHGSVTNVRIIISKGKSSIIHSYPEEKLLDTDGRAKIKDDILYVGKFHGHIDFYPGIDNTGNERIKIQGATYYKVQ